MSERLQKVIAESGLMSRRAAEEAILTGRVKINGRTAVLGEKADADDQVCIDGKPIPKPEEKRYYMLNKPRGYVCTMKDEKGRRSVRELLPKNAGRVYPVGRLDLMSEGLLLMSNDGDFTLRVTHPSGELLKTYRTEVSGVNTQEAARRLREPFRLDGVTVQAVEVSLVEERQGSTVLDITIREGRNRQIRRMCEMAGLHVERLIRIKEGPLVLGDLPTGSVRLLKKHEVAAIMEESGE